LEKSPSQGRQEEKHAKRKEEKKKEKPWIPRTKSKRRKIGRERSPSEAFKKEETIGGERTKVRAERPFSVKPTET